MTFGTVAGPAALSVIGTIAFVAVLYRLRQARREGADPGRLVSTAVFLCIWASFAVVATIVASVSLYSRHSYLQRSMEAGRVNVVEGVVTNFDPMPYG